MLKARAQSACSKRVLKACVLALPSTARAVLLPFACPDAHLSPSPSITPPVPPSARVAKLFEKTAAVLYGGLAELDYSGDGDAHGEGLGWGDAEMEALALVLPLCKQLTSLTLDGNAMSALPANLGEAVPKLEFLHLGDCDALTALPASVCELPALRSLLLHDCSSLVGVPDELHKLSNSLEELHLGGCAALKAVPECVKPLRAAGKCRVTLPRPLMRKEDEEEKARAAAATVAEPVG